ncbi:type VII secretion target [Amycolatopsis sp. CA-128772]|uniref:type VII secretion target n=1 Tax=Amycolatopsis sp. CA-128772 TaxID=2073159 RepID=UPI000CD0AB4B|nr:type VII secretion target [Amycolatopsis sp. CA-128772]
MDGYAVKADELGKLIGDLDMAAGRMTDANKKLGGGGAFGSLGTAELGKAGAEFEEAWGYGIGRLGDAASEVTERLKTAKQKYEQIEAQFGGELGEFGSAVLGDGPAGGEPAGGAKGDHPRIGPPADGPVGGGYTGGVRGIGDLADGSGGPSRVNRTNELAGPASEGITDLLNGLDR